MAVLSAVLAAAVLAAPPARAFPADAAERFHEAYYNDGEPPPIFWLGAPSRQNPMDNWVMQELLDEVRPGTIVETGTAEGGTALYYAMLMEFIRPDSSIVTIDVEDMGGRWREHALWKRRVRFLQADSVAPATVAEVASRVARGAPVLATLDSLHSYEHVLREMELYSRLVTPGSYLVVQDTNLNGHPVYPAHGPGPWEAVEEFLRAHPEFERDLSRERLRLTFYPGGWLKKTSEGPAWGGTAGEVVENLRRAARTAAGPGKGADGLAGVYEALRYGSEVERWYAGILLSYAPRPASERALRDALGDRSPIVRRQAVEALARLGARSAAGELRGLLRDRIVGPNAARALASLGFKEAAPDLLSVVRDPGADSYWRGEAARALGVLGHRPAAPALARILRDADAAPVLRAAAAAALAGIKDASAAPALEAALLSGPGIAGYHSARALAALGPGIALSPLRRAAADRRRLYPRVGAVLGLGKLRDRGSLRALTAVFGDAGEESAVRKAVLTAVAAIDGAGALKLLESGLGDPELAVRFQAVVELGALRADGAVGLLEKAAGAREPEVRLEAVRGLARMGTAPSRDALRRLSAGEFLDVRREAAAALAASRPAAP